MIATLLLTGLSKGHFNTKLFRYKSFRYKVLSIQVKSVEVQIVSLSWLMEWYIFTPFVFLVHVLTVLYVFVFETVVQFHCLSTYWNKVVSKRLTYLIGSQRKVTPPVLDITLHLCTFHPDPCLWDSNLTVYAKTQCRNILLDSLKISLLTFASITEIWAQLVQSDYNLTSCSIINWLINLYYSVPVSEHLQTIRT